MRKTTKRLFALLLVLTMVVSLLPTIAFARFDGEAVIWQVLKAAKTNPAVELKKE